MAQYYNSYKNNTKDYSDERQAVKQHINQLAYYPEYLASVKVAKTIITLTAGHTPGTPAASWADQLYRAAASVPANISEGVGRMMKSQVIQFLRIARGSAFETFTHLNLCPIADIDTAELRKQTCAVIVQIDTSIAKLIEPSA